MLPIKTIDQVVTGELEARWQLRTAARGNEVFRAVLRAFVDRGGPVAAPDLAPWLPTWSADAVNTALKTLDEQDLLVLEGGAVVMAYPFAAVPNAFAVDFSDGRARYACCALDALGLAPMIGRRIAIRSRCHHCDEPLSLAATPDGAEGGEGVLVWLGQRPTGDRICTSL